VPKRATITGELGAKIHAVRSALTEIYFGYLSFATAKETGQ
jgi:hypothetical protein